jgi:hypothetical protein
MSLKIVDMATVKSTFLGNCIKNWIPDRRIKDIAERAAWLGNDEVHYERKWIDKDVQDLNALIRLVTSYIASEREYQKMMEDMPPKSG